MHASIVVLSALVAVAAGQYGYHWGYSGLGGMPINPYLGVPFDTHEVRAGKIFHANQIAMRGGFASVVRKRREANPEPAATETKEEAAAEPKTDKRAIFYSAIPGYAGWGSSYLGVSPYSAFTYPSIYYRKRRDTNDAEATEAVEATEDESPEARQKRQYFDWAGYPTYMRSYFPSIYGRSYLYRKRRDISEETPKPEETPKADEPQQNKRQLAYLGYPSIMSYSAPMVYSTPYYSGWSPSWTGLFRKRRDVSEETPKPEEAPKADEPQQNKRQLAYLGYPGLMSYSAPMVYSTPYYSGWSPSWTGLFRKRRDTADAPAAEEPTKKDKRYLFPTTYAAYTPYVSYSYPTYGFRSSWMY